MAKSLQQQMTNQVAYQIGFKAADSLYYQWALGLVPDDEWRAARDEITSRLTEDNSAQETWTRSINGVPFTITALSPVDSW